MILFFKKRLARQLAITTLFSLLFQLLLPTVSYALTDGPASPEFSDFESVISTDMVNTFTGDLSYNLPVINVPGPSGSGYAMSLSYHQGMSPEQEASWVGFGWTLNPGIINRSKAGLPDDFDGSQVQKTYNKVPPSWTGSANKTASANFAGYGLSGSFQGRNYSNYGGFSKFYGLGVTVPVGDLGSASLGMNVSNGEPTFSLSASPAILTKALKGAAKKVANKIAKATVKKTRSKTGKRGYNSKAKAKIGMAENFASGLVGSGSISVFGGEYGIFARGQFNQQLAVSPAYGFSFRYTNSNTGYLGWFFPIDFHQIGGTASVGFQGNVNVNGNVPVVENSMVGYIHSNSERTKRTGSFPNYTFSENLHDYYVEKQSTYNRRMKYLGIPFANPDNFMVAGERLSGAFRAHHDRVGHFYPTNATSITKIYNGGPLKEAALVGPAKTPLGFPVPVTGAGVAIGTTFLSGKSKIELQDWDYSGPHKNDPVNRPAVHPDQVAYAGGANHTSFRFTSDMAGDVSYTDHDGVVAAELRKANSPNFIPGTRGFNPNLEDQFYKSGGNPYGDINDGQTMHRSSYIEPGYVSGKLNDFRVTNQEGSRFVYGIPVHSRNESNTQIHIDTKPSDGYIAQQQYWMDDEYLEPIVDPQKPDLAVPYFNNTDANLTANVKNDNQSHNEHIVGTYTQEPYATNYLMTEILTADYVDREGASPSDPDFGISENDFGGWTKFNYRKKYGAERDLNGDGDVSDGGEAETNWYRWRMPYYGLKYEQGELSTKKDDMGSVSTGEKEVFYLGQIETKTHIAFFVTNDANPNDFNSVSIDDLSPIDAYLSGTGTPRKDGFSSKRPNATTFEDEVANMKKNDGPRGGAGLEYLEKIVLFSKKDLENNANPKPLKTVRFEYEYGLCKGLPNSNGVSGQNGKLTLKKVWTEYNGTFNTRISPYVFDYNYPEANNYGAFVRRQYGHFLDDYYGLKNNPAYAPQNLDRWGFNQYNGAQRFSYMQEWLYQGVYGTAAKYDPAAWQLKKITLPSGGEMHIHYEEKDYQKVQDKNALAMVSLKTNSKDDYEPDNNKFYLNLDDIDVKPSETGALIAKIQDEFIEEEKFIKFKFLYALKGAISQNPENALKECKAEYITGYVKVTEVAEDAGGVYLTLGEDRVFPNHGSPLYQVVFGNENTRAVPKQACIDYLVAQRMGMVDNNDCTLPPRVEENNSDSDDQEGPNGWRDMQEFDDEVNRYYLEEATYDNDNTVKGKVDDDRGMAPMGKRDREYSDNNGTNPKTGQKYAKGRRGEMREDVIRYLNSYSTDKESKDLLRDAVRGEGDYCMDLCFPLSYLRIPMLKAKRGGGIRVKRVMFYDEGIESGDEALYGTEYDYVKEDGTSSGIATNEPQVGREENALVSLVARYEQSLFSKLVAGRYQQEFEGPIGESLMPSATVGHSRVVVHNIYRQEHDPIASPDQWLQDNRSLGGFMVYEYHTADEYPMNESTRFPLLGETDEGEKAVDYTDVTENRKRDWLPLPLGFININIKKEWATQGYNFIIHNRHGEIKKQLSYSGVYQKNKAIADYPLISSSVFEYFEPGEEINLIDDNGNVVKGLPGKEMDIAMESKQVKQTTSDFTLPFTIGLMIAGAPPYVGVTVGLGFTYSYSNKKMSTHLTSKLTRYPTILKSTTTINDGVQTYQENLAFDKATGKPILTKAYDEYDGELLARSNRADNTGAGVEHVGAYYSLRIPAHLKYAGLRQKTTDEANAADYTNELTLGAGNIVTYGEKANPMDYLSSTVSIFDVFDADQSTEPSVSGNWVFDDLQKTVIMSDAQTFGQFNFGTGWYPRTTVVTGNTANAKWRPYQSYAFKTDRTTSHHALPEFTGAEDQRIYNAGTFQTFDMFDYDDPANNGDEWIKVNEVTLYSEHGEALEEINALDIYSAARFDGVERLPSMIAGNARYNEIGYRNFEGTGSVDNMGHSGSYCEQFTNSAILFSTVSVTDASLAMVWLRNDQVDLKGNVTIGGVNAERIAQTGEWELYTARITSGGSIVVQSGTATTTYMDDVRIQPYDSEANCYVYDDLYRLVASFDDQHFGMYYEYNPEGKLVRKRIETERGFMTIQETQYNTPSEKQ